MESLAQTMSVEAIAAIKAKRLAMKRHDKDSKANSQRLQREQEREQQRLVDEHKANLCKRAMERERQHRTYEEQLLGEKELPGVLRTLAQVFDMQKRRLLPAAKPDAGATERPEPGKFREVPVVPTNKNPLVKESTSRYNRYGQEKFLKDQKPFGINPLGSNLNKKKEAGKEMGREKGKEPAKEICLKTSEKAGKEAGKEAFQKTSEEAGTEAGKEAGKVAGKVVITRVRPALGHRRSTPQKERRRSTKPIIVVPAALTSLVTLHNARQLLQEMRFVPMDQARKSGAQQTEEVVIERRVQGELVRYRVIDNVKRLKPEEWERVAAVFAMGPQWQFKGWPHGGDPAVIFHEVCAFHLHFKDSAPSKELRNLQVHMLALPQHERHSDCGVLKEFWKKLDHHIAVRPKQFAFMKQK